MSSKYLTPYRTGSIGEESYIRNFLDSNTHGFSVWKNRSGSYWSYIYPTGMYNIKKANSLQDAKRWLDESLIENGYILLAEEQVQKLQLLC